MRACVASLSALAMAVASTPAAAECSQAESDARVAVLKSAVDCVRDNARSLEKSHETAEAIASASMSLCRKGILTIGQMCGGPATEAYAEKHLPEMAIEEVVTIRARRNTK